jgi:hypothetical protein
MGEERGWDRGEWRGGERGERGEEEGCSRFNDGFSRVRLYKYTITKTKLPEHQKS